jgi:hypothetical protein
MLLIGLGILPKNALYRCCRDSMALGDLSQALALATIALDTGMIEYQRITADVLAFKTGTPQSTKAPLHPELKDLNPEDYPDTTRWPFWPTWRRTLVSTIPIGSVWARKLRTTQNLKSNARRS